MKTQPWENVPHAPATLHSKGKEIPHVAPETRNTQKHITNIEAQYSLKSQDILQEERSTLEPRAEEMEDSWNSQSQGGP